MEITSIKQQLKNSERVSLFVDGKYSFSLSLNQLLAEKLKVGQKIDDPRLKYLQKLSAEEKIKIKALNWVLIRPHSNKELQDYLKRKKIELDLANLITSEFNAKNYINDKEFAQWWAENRLNSKHASTRRIIYELRLKGIDEKLISEVLSGINSNDKDSLKVLIDKKSRSARYKDPKKLTEYLLRQGFSYSDIKNELQA